MSGALLPSAVSFPRWHYCHGCGVQLGHYALHLRYQDYDDRCAKPECRRAGAIASTNATIARCIGSLDKLAAEWARNV